ncbi:hypothetical protein OH77DRAFT_426122 [Trametes cingulata]|nr:hypothetical protein OH77DRAFT_426122 [Trametes cingulata]
MGVYETVIKDVFPDPSDRPNFVLCSNTHGLYSKGFLHSVHTAVGQIQLGIVPDTMGHNYEASYTAADRLMDAQLSLNDIADVSPGAHPPPRYLNLRNTIAALQNAPGLRASWEPFQDVRIAMLSKLVVNAFINPVSALLQCRNGEVFNSNYGSIIADRVCREAERVFRSQWIAEVHYQIRTAKEETGLAVRPAPFPRQLEAAVMRREIQRVVEMTKNNYSSMYMDVKLRRPTEIDFINGHIVAMGKKHKYRSLMNISLMELIKMRSAIPLAPQP